MFVHRFTLLQVGLLVVIALLGPIFLGGTHSARAQDGDPAAVYPAGAVVDVGDSWRLTVSAVTVDASSPDAGATTPQPLLAASLTVDNLASQPRNFPTYRVHLLSASGVTFADTWCAGAGQSLEVAPAIPPNGTATGTLCWTLPSADTAPVVLAVDAALSVAAPRVTFALNPVKSTPVPSLPTPTPSPAVLLPALASDAERGPADRSEPSGGQCSQAYSLYANANGSYNVPVCGTPGISGGASNRPAVPVGAAVPCQLYPSGAQPSGAGAISGSTSPQCPSTSAGSGWNTNVIPCQLYPSASQPGGSSTSSIGTGARLQAAASAAPPCPLAGGAGGSSTNGGVPACRLWASGAQPSTSTYGTGTTPLNLVTPVAAPTVALPPGGALAGAPC